jgi:uncharacterized membrane protein YozB (DUF420 family)
MSSALIFQIQSFIILCILTFGILNRKNRNKHIRAMFTAIIWDILLVLQIELTRDAINKASKVVTNPFILNFHVSLAVSCVLLYFAMLYTGNKLKQNNNSFRNWHKRLGMFTYVLRILTFITSFYAVIPKQ